MESAYNGRRGTIIDIQDFSKCNYLNVENKVATSFTSQVHSHELAVSMCKTIYFNYSQEFHFFPLNNLITEKEENYHEIINVQAQRNI